MSLLPPIHRTTTRDLRPPLPLAHTLTHKTRLEHEHYKTALDACAYLRARLLTLQANTKHALARAEREAALWRTAEHKKEAMLQQQHQQQAEAGAAAAPVGAVMGEN